MKKIIVEYSANNSGGDWWLKDKDWKALEKAGWLVDWNRKFKYKDGNHVYNKDGLPELLEIKNGWTGEDGRHLGALAHYAYKKFSNIQQALQEFEKITRQNISDEGCNCCGAPHRFSWWPERYREGNEECASGEDLLKYLYPDKKIPKNIREAMKLLEKN